MKAFIAPIVVAVLGLVICAICICATPFVIYYIKKRNQKLEKEFDDLSKIPDSVALAERLDQDDSQNASVRGF